MPGATLETILKQIERASRRAKNWDLCIILGGICNITNRIATKGHRYIEYTISKVDECKAAIDQIFESSINHLHICTITPASLAKYLNHRNGDPKINEEQTNLLHDIEIINNYIKEYNISKDRPTIDVAKQSYSLSLKKQGKKNKRNTKFQDKDLPDGVHPSITLEQKRAKYMANMACKIIKKEHTIEMDTNPSSSDETEDEGEHCYFKRQKTK